MDISKIKHLVKSNGDKFIFVENGEPEIVMMSFQEFEKLAGNNVHQPIRHSPMFDALAGGPISTDDSWANRDGMGYASASNIYPARTSSTPTRLAEATAKRVGGRDTIVDGSIMLPQTQSQSTRSNGVYERSVFETREEELLETEFIPASQEYPPGKFDSLEVGSGGLPIRLEDIRLEDLPI